MPKNMSQMQLMEPRDLAVNSDGAAAGAPPDGGIKAQPMDSMEEISSNLKAFTDNVHQKASQVVTWIQNCEQMKDNERATKFLVLFCFFEGGSIAYVIY